MWNINEYCFVNCSKLHCILSWNSAVLFTGNILKNHQQTQHELSYRVLQFSLVIISTSPVFKLFYILLGWRQKSEF